MQDIAMKMDPQQEHALSFIFARNTAETISVSKFKWFLYATGAFSTVVYTYCKRC